VLFGKKEIVIAYVWGRWRRGSFMLDSLTGNLNKAKGVILKK